MSVTISAAKYPAYSAGTGVSGKRLVMYVNYGTGATAQNPVWTLVGGLTSNSFSISAETSSQQTKDTGYWSASAITSKSYEVSAEVVMLRDNEAQEAIEAFMVDDAITSAKKLLNIAIVDLDTLDYYNLTVAPTSWEITAESEDMVTKSFSAVGSGAPVKAANFSGADATAMTYSKASSADIVYTVPGETITGLKNGSTNVTSSNYSIAAGSESIVIKSSYLSTLSNGSVTFNIQLSGGGVVAKAVTIAA